MTAFEDMRRTAKLNPGARCDWPAPDGSTVRCVYRRTLDRYGRPEKHVVAPELEYSYMHLPSGLNLSARQAERILSGANVEEIEAEIAAEGERLFWQLKLGVDSGWGGSGA